MQCLNVRGQVWTANLAFLMMLWLCITAVYSDFSSLYVRKRAKKLLKYAVAAKVLAPRFIPVPVYYQPHQRQHHIPYAQPVRVIHQHHFWDPWNTQLGPWGSSGLPPAAPHADVQNYHHRDTWPNQDYWQGHQSIQNPQPGGYY